MSNAIGVSDCKVISKELFSGSFIIDTENLEM